MVNCCCLPDCWSGCVGADIKISVFSAPKNASLFEKWSRALKKFGVDFRAHHFVCEKHFQNDDILREKVLRDLQGNIIFQKKFDRKRLRHGAVPFASAPSLGATVDNHTIPVTLNIMDGEGASGTSVTETMDNVGDLAVTNTVENHEAEDKSVEFTGIELNKKLTLFDDIYTGIIKLKLPDSSWGIHMREDPIKYITISQVAKCTDTDKVPTYVKQITLDEQLHLKLFILHSKIVERAATTVEGIQSALEELCNLQICTGGPLLTTFKTVNPKCAYKDFSSNRWRHNLCTLVTECLICSKCRSLDSLLRAHLDRKNKLKKLQIVMSPTQKKKIEVLRKAHRVQMQAYKRSQQKIKVIKAEVTKLQNKVTEISEATFEESINKLNLPHAQVDASHFYQLLKF